MTDIEIRAQAVYSYTSGLVVRFMDECANLRGELAVRDAQVKDLQAKLAEALKPKDAA